MGSLTFILGGARSGKSSYAQRLAEKQSRPVTFIATANASDDEMAARILQHQSQRPPDWITREIHYDIAAQLAPSPPEVVLLDCVTLLVSNLLLRDGQAEPDEPAATARVETEIGDLLNFVRERGTDWIMVSNEVGLGLVPPYRLGRLYRDLLGRSNQRLAAAADRVIWMVAGIPVPIQDCREPPG